MNRRFRNSLSAITCSSAALAIALMVAVPTPEQHFSPAAMATSQRAGNIDSLARAVALSAEIASASAMALDAEQDMDAPTTQHAPRQGRHHRRQTLVMPYFSFSPRG